MTAKCTAQCDHSADLASRTTIRSPRPSSPGVPGRFEGQEIATGYCRAFFPWYNHHHHHRQRHRHGGIAMLTPADLEDLRNLTPADVYFGKAPGRPPRRSRSTPFSQTMNGESDVADERRGAPSQVQSRQPFLAQEPRRQKTALRFY